MTLSVVVSLLLSVGAGVYIIIILNGIETCNDESDMLPPNIYVRAEKTSAFNTHTQDATHLSLQGHFAGIQRRVVLEPLSGERGDGVVVGDPGTQVVQHCAAPGGHQQAVGSIRRRGFVRNLIALCLVYRRPGHANSLFLTQNIDTYFVVCTHSPMEPST
jgi:hypothetical protein